MVGAVTRPYGLLIRIERSGLAVYRESRPAGRRARDDMDDAAHRPGSIQVRRPARNDFNPRNVVGDQSPVYPSSESVIERNAVEQDQRSTSSQAVQRDGLRGGMIVAAAERCRLHAGDRPEQIVELMSAGIGRTVDLLLRDDGHGCGALPGRFGRFRCGDDDLVRGQLEALTVCVVRSFSGGSRHEETGGMETAESSDAANRHVLIAHSHGADAE